MTAELAAKGVTAEQVERIKNKYQNQQQDWGRNGETGAMYAPTKRGMETTDNTISNCQNRQEDLIQQNNLYRIRKTNFRA